MEEMRWSVEDLLAKALAVAPGSLYVYNQKTQSSEYASRTLSNLLGYTASEAKEMGSDLLPRLCHPEDLPKVFAHFAAIQAADDDEVMTVEYRMRHKDGFWVYLMSRDMVFDRDADGAVLRHVGEARDITDQKGKETAAAALADELETIFNAATSGIVALNAVGEIVRINNHARHMLGGVSESPPFAWPDDVRFLDADTLQPLEASADPIQRALAGHVLRNETQLMRRPQALEERRYVRVANAKPANAAGGIHTVLVIDDVSNEERNRQAVERKGRLDALGQLTGGIAHDFNNLLASLLYAIDLAAGANTDERRDFFLDTAKSSIQRGRGLTARLLAFARKQPGLASVRRTEAVISDFPDLVRPMIEAQIDIVYKVDETDLRHYCDQVQLETALMNLVLNARDAILRAGKGSKIEIVARSVRAPHKFLDGQQSGSEAAEGASFRYIEISVSDDGPGMDEETQARCTDPFFTTKESNSGTGLGLAMVYGFVRQSDGDLRIYSEPGVGTTVQMTLPRGSELGVREAAIEEEVVERGAGQRLLVVEDELQLLVMITDVLEDLGYQVIPARSAQDALDIVSDGVEIDLLITDVVMPGKFGGFELARRLRALRPGVPVIYTSGYTGFTASEMGDVVAPLLQKPAPPSELSAEIRKALSGGNNGRGAPSEE